MDREITVAHLKPDGLSQMSHCLQAKECIALHAPASLFAKKSSEYVGDGIEVGRDVQSPPEQDRKSTRLNSSHSQISYAVFCLKTNTHSATGQVHVDADRLREDRAAFRPHPRLTAGRLVLALGANHQRVAHRDSPDLVHALCSQ